MGDWTLVKEKKAQAGKVEAGVHDTDKTKCSSERVHVLGTAFSEKLCSVKNRQNDLLAEYEISRSLEEMRVRRSKSLSQRKEGDQSSGPKRHLAKLVHPGHSHYHD